MSSAASTEEERRLLVTLGSERFPFDRLMGWIDAWLRRPPRPTRCLVQRGTSVVPVRADSETYLPFDRLVEEIRRADVVVTHGGTGSIMLCRRLGRLPVVVPRRRDLGEAVDDHQVPFARRMAALNEIVLAESEPELAAALDRAVVDPTAMRVEPRPERVAEAIDRFDRLVTPLMRRRR